MVHGQLSLLGHEAPAFDAAFGDAERVELAGEAWYEYAPGWLAGHATMFDALEQTMRWQTGKREMYERVVEVPRLHATVPDDGPGHPLLDEIREVLGVRYGERFVRTSMALYRDGRDSVAWHGDYVARSMPRSLMATVSLGAPRKFLLRSGSGKAICSSWAARSSARGSTPCPRSRAPIRASW
jgi:alkylated DNA repair dioxygenase AlkB